MKNMDVNRLAEHWKSMTSVVLKVKEINFTALQGLLKETYALLCEFQKEALVPKMLCALFLEMESFLYFAFLMEDKEVDTDYYAYRQVDAVVRALKDGFFNGEYPVAYPALQLVDDTQKVRVFHFEKDMLNDLLK